MYPESKGSYWLKHILSQLPCHPQLATMYTYFCTQIILF